MFSKTLLVGVLVTLGSAAHATEAQFCKGFAIGFVQGWNALSAQQESPPVPACEIGMLENDDDSTLSSFEQGEKKGRQRGIKAYKDDLDSGSSTDLARKEAAKAQQVAEQQAAVEEEKQRAAEAAKEKEAVIAQSKGNEQEYMQHAVALVTCLKDAIAHAPQPPANETGRFRQAYIDMYQRQEPEREAGLCHDAQILGVIQHACALVDAPADVRAALKVQAARRGVTLSCEAPSNGPVATAMATPVAVHSPSESGPAPSLEARPQPSVTAPSTAIRPSFDCNNAATQVEKLICANPQLADADANLAILYRKTVAASNRSAVLPSQRAFVAKRNLCTTVPCIEEAYRTRYAELAAMRFSTE